MSWNRAIHGAAETNSPCSISEKLVCGIFEGTVLYLESAKLIKNFFFSPLQCRISVCPMAHPWTLLAQPPPHPSSTDCSWMMTWMWKLETSLLLLMIPKNTCAQSYEPFVQNAGNIRSQGQWQSHQELLSVMRILPLQIQQPVVFFSAQCTQKSGKFSRCFSGFQRTRG